MQKVNISLGRLLGWGGPLKAHLSITRWLPLSPLHPVPQAHVFAFQKIEVVVYFIPSRLVDGGEEASSHLRKAYGDHQVFPL